MEDAETKTKNSRHVSMLSQFDHTEIMNEDQIKCLKEGRMDGWVGQDREDQESHYWMD